MPIETPRLRLRTWRDTDRDAFAALHADPEVMTDLGGPMGRPSSDNKLARYMAAFRKNGFGRWLVETPAGEFLGYAGIMRVNEPHPLGPHCEIGWRLKRSAWGHGYATEAAAAALDDAFQRSTVNEVLAYTAAENLRSQGVINRLQMHRDPSRDFAAVYDDVGLWRGLVWVCKKAASKLAKPQSDTGFGT